MKHSTKDAINGGILLVMVVLFVGGIVFGIANLGYQDSKRDKYCKNLFPSPLEKKFGFERTWGETDFVEEGYVRCCRNYAENHEIREGCDVFEYLDGKK